MKAYIVEDDDSLRLILKRLLKKNFPEINSIDEGDSAEKALVEIPGCKPDITLVDISLPGMDGIELIEKLKPSCQKGGFIVLTGHEIDRFQQAAVNAGAFGIVSKMDHERLLRVIRKLLNKEDRGTNGFP